MRALIAASVALVLVSTPTEASLLRSSITKASGDHKDRKNTEPFPKLNSCHPKGTTPKSDTAQCSYIANLNFTSPDIEPATYLVSSYDCCALCTGTVGCNAAFYDNYYCHLKSGTGTQSSVGGTAIFPGGTASPAPPAPPLPPTPTGTAAPTIKPHTVPPLTPAPIPVTPAPTSGTNSYNLVRRLYCQYSAGCHQDQDSTCVTNWYKANECYYHNNNANFGNIFTCSGQNVIHEEYNNQQCTGVATDHVQTNASCYETKSYDYRKTSCNYVTEVNGIGIIRQSCQTDSGTQCSSEYFVSGQCTTNSDSSRAGKSMKVFCNNEFVWYTTYPTTDCSGNTYNLQEAEPVNYKWQNSNYNWIKWSC